MTTPPLSPLYQGGPTRPVDEATRPAGGLTLVQRTDAYVQALAPLLAGEFDPDDPDEAAALEAQLDVFDAAGLSLRDKAQACAGTARSLRLWAKNLADERAALEQREERYIKQAVWLENNLLECMRAARVDRFEGGRFTIRVQTNPPKCEVVEEQMVPAGFLRHIPEKVIPERWEVNKTAVNEAFKNGEVVPGTIVTRSEKVVIGS